MWTCLSIGLGTAQQREQRGGGARDLSEEHVETWADGELNGIDSCSKLYASWDCWFLGIHNCKVKRCAADSLRYPLSLSETAKYYTLVFCDIAAVEAVHSQSVALPRLGKVGLTIQHVLHPLACARQGMATDIHETDILLCDSLWVV